MIKTQCTNEATKINKACSWKACNGFHLDSIFMWIQTTKHSVLTWFQVVLDLPWTLDNGALFTSQILGLEKLEKSHLLIVRCFISKFHCTNPNTVTEKKRKACRLFFCHNFWQTFSLNKKFNRFQFQEQFQEQEEFASGLTEPVMHIITKPL